MTNTNTTLAVATYFESEYERLVELLHQNPDWLTPSEAVHNTLQRTLGVAEFAQTLGIEFQLVEALYEDLKTRCYALLEIGA